MLTTEAKNLKRMVAARGGATSLWWDLESCPLPSYIDPYIVVSMAPALLRKFNITTSSSMLNAGGQTLHHHPFSAYELFSETQTELRQTLINSGIELHQLPPGQTSNEMEKMMMIDILLWAKDTPPPANIICIVGRVDFCYVFQKLQQRSYNVFLVCQSMSKMPQGMLGAVNAYLGWLSFLGSLQDEDQQSHFPNPNEQENPMASSGGWNSNPNDKTKSEGNPRAETDPKASTEDLSWKFMYYMPGPQENPMDSSGGWNSNPNQKIKSEGNPRAETDPKASTEDLSWKFMYHMPGPQGFFMAPLDKRTLQHTGNKNFKSKGKPGAETDPKASAEYFRTFRSPVSSASSSQKKKLASLEEFKAWLTLVVNGKQHTEEGYQISSIRVDFEKATGKILDQKFLGFSKILNLVKDCNDIAIIKEVKRGCYRAFPVKPYEQKKSMPSPGGWN